MKRAKAVRRSPGTTTKRAAPPRKRAAPPGERAAVSREARRIEKAIERLGRAQLDLTVRAADLLGIADGIARVAGEKAKDEVIRDLLDRGIPQEALEHAEAPEERHDGPDEPRRFARAVLNWLSAGFGIEPSHRTGQEIEVPGPALAEFDCVDDGVAHDRVLVRLRVTRSGLRRGRRLILRPRARIVPDPGEPDPTPVN